jgi:hypothetical protein
VQQGQDAERSGPGTIDPMTAPERLQPAAPPAGSSSPMTLLREMFERVVVPKKAEGR